MLESLLSAALATALLAGTAGHAFAQDANTAAPAASGQSANGTAQVDAQAASGVLAVIDRDEVPVPQLNLMVDQVDDMDVVGPNGEAVGEVDDVLGDANGNAKAISVEVGGFLGIGEKTIILMLDDVSLDMGRIKTALTKEQIEKLPSFGG
ncbi:PRC-barrel domain-containing protein [Jiella pacifica]|uniref:PRC-barrel domain containing protein n=1 Tax=Jiella pacifica TaxID=2696469 RepID=A0A6N9T354_9HYPH|nr:PRC-barrel domain-containing protein [Jiella pacifica]NDW05803.1 PRC-barrel domain containing protein [Jiella pacifica]